MHGIAERMQDWLSGVWHLLSAQCLLAEQLEDRLRSDGGQELAFRIRPYVSIAGLQQHWPWRDQRNKHVRVYRKLIYLIAVLLVIGAKLIWVSRRFGQMF